MTAQQMFEELGYEKTSENENGILYSDIFSQVAFFKKDKKYGVYTIMKKFKASTNLHKAIHQQLKELGWIE